jgi:hypothetical protein
MTRLLAVVIVLRPAPFRLSFQGFGHSRYPRVIKRVPPPGFGPGRPGKVTRVQVGPVYQFQHGGTRKMLPDVGAGGCSNPQPAPTSVGPSSAAPSWAFSRLHLPFLQVPNQSPDSGLFFFPHLELSI